MADAGAPSADGVSGCTEQSRLNAHNRVFGIGEIAEPRALRTFEIFRLAAAAKYSDEPRNRAIGVNDGDGAAAPHQIAPDRPGKPREIGHVAAIDQLRARV